MFLLFTFASVIVAVYLVDSFGGMAATVEALAAQDAKPDIAAWHGTVGPGTEWATPADFITWLLIMDVAWAVTYMVSPWQSSRHLMARDEHVVIRAAIYTCLAVGLLQIVIYGAGGIVNLARFDIEPFSGGWHDRFGLPFPASSHGYGMTYEEVLKVRASAEDLRGYFDATYAMAVGHLGGVTDADLDRVVDEDWDPPVTLGVRLVSVLNDCTQHVGQASYAAGILARG